MFFRTRDLVASQLVGLGVAPSAADRLSGAGTLLELPAGTTLCTRGERGTQAFLLVDGTASVRTADETITVGPGDVIGEIAALDSTRYRNADVVTATEVSILVFDLATFRSLASTDELNDRLVPQRTAA